MTLYNQRTGERYIPQDSSGRKLGGIRLAQHEAKLLRTRPDKYQRLPPSKTVAKDFGSVGGGASLQPFSIAVQAVPAPGTGLRHNTGKPRMDLIPPEALVRLGQVLTKGSEKYAERNWELGMDRGKVIASAMRHLVAYMAGEQIDAETGLPHAALLMTNAAFLVAYDDRQTCPDLDSRSKQAVVVK